MPIAHIFPAQGPLRRGHSRLRRQAGLSLLDVTLALVVSAAAVAMAVRTQLRQQEEHLAQAEAVQLGQLANAMQDYLDRYREIIVKQRDGIAYPPNVRDEYDQTHLPAGMLAGSTGHPSINQLKLLGILPANYQAQSFVSEQGYTLTRIQAATANNTDVDLTQENNDCLRHVCTLRLLAHTHERVSSQFTLSPLDPTVGLWDDRLARLIINKLPEHAEAIGVMAQLGSLIPGASAYPGQSRMVASDGTDWMANPVAEQAVGIIGAVVQTRYQPPIASSDYCPAGWWAFNSSGVSQAISAAQAPALEATHCVATHADVARGLQTTATDYRGSLRGHVQLLCTLNASGQLTLLDVRTSGETQRLSDSACGSS